MEFFMILFCSWSCRGNRRQSCIIVKPEDHRPSSSRHLLVIRKYFIIVFVKKFSGVPGCSQVFPRSCFKWTNLWYHLERPSTLRIVLPWFSCSCFYHSRRESRVERW
jgi:hypothetical protein